MTTRRIITGLLLTLAVGSAGYAVLKEAVWRPARAATPATAANLAPQAPGPSGDQLLVTYFHGTIRCVTCNAIERMTKQVLDRDFAGELQIGRVAWRTDDFQENEALAARYGLTSSSVVLVRQRGGQELGARRLDDVWRLADQPELFSAYIRRSVAEDLTTGGSRAAAPVAVMPWWAALASALWLGILTSISPCPLASNIAAISFIGRKVGQPRQVVLAGLLYTLGRTAAYLGLAVLILAGLLASGMIARFLQRYLSQALGPVLVLVGMVLLGLLGATLSFNLAGPGVQERAGKGGTWWAGVLGLLFALSFCPVSAGLYFGGLLPLSAAQQSRVALPALFGVGTALPVIGFAFLIAFASQHVARAFNRLTQVERWVRTATGVVFVVAGLYYCLTAVYGVPLA